MFKNLDNVHSELESLKANYSKVQQQCSAPKPCNKTLTSNVKSPKEKITSMTVKLRRTKQGSQEHRDLFSNSDFDVLQDIGKYNCSIRTTRSFK